MKLSHCLRAFLILFTGLISCNKDTPTTGNTGNNSPTLPVVSTTTVSGIVGSEAISGGNVTSDGGATVTARGVCWGTSPAPTISGNSTNDGSGIGTFQSSITGLSKSTSYYVRAYATNSVGTAYGTDQIFVTADPDVYVVGNDFVTGTNNAVYRAIKMWKNGVATQITNNSGGSNATGIYVSGNDVYISGYENVGAKVFGKIWKNGVATTVSSTTGDTYAHTVCVSGSDVYVGGIEYTNSTAKAAIWKNGVAITLDNTSADPYIVNSICISGSDIYACGSQRAGSGTRGIIWKNGTIISLNPGIDNCKSIAVSGNDIYVTGHSVAGVAGNKTYYTAKFYKNGIVTTLQNMYGGSGGGSTYGNSISIIGSDVYVAGSETVDINANAGEYTRVWKNGVILTEYSGNRTANSIFSANGQIYVVGLKSAPLIGTAATIWKNAVPSYLESAPNVFNQSNSEATGVFVR